MVNFFKPRYRTQPYSNEMYRLRSTCIFMKIISTSSWLLNLYKEAIQQQTNKKTSVLMFMFQKFYLNKYILTIITWFELFRIFSFKKIWKDEMLLFPPKYIRIVVVSSRSFLGEWVCHKKVLKYHLISIGLD